ncbi:putative sulfate exporter family transporter [Fibrella sp. HMF5335]|uniref:Sulfate exporter family transporter n=1 Tax=Fibrella rubiginis TaxID=2817060 RepID=A0A939GDS5_9BACT|nr:putative sulfate exporter family transporter [Fibrella rubiginis]MBO0936496.1 putative sulfate exporter family transporter [Fibrella rubiginis]
MNPVTITQKPDQPQPESLFKQAHGLFYHTYTTREIIFGAALILCLTPLMSPPLALLLGLIMAQFVGHPFLRLNNKLTHWLLQASVVGLGFGMNVHSAVQAGKEGVLFTVASIAGTLTVGILLGKWLKIDRITAHLIAAGTAICGGSAIAALSPVIKAEEKQLSVSLGTVFMLNSVALIVFPLIGQWLHLTPAQFGLWCALAIHDTSSVVGAAAKFGPEALQLATTVKLARALWIIPVALGTAALFKTGKGKITIPYFIGLFILAMVAHTYLPVVEPVAQVLVHLAHIGLTLTLFLIGAGLSVSVIRAVGWKPMVQGIVLWILISVVSLYAILHLG